MDLQNTLHTKEHASEQIVVIVTHKTLHHQNLL